MNLASSASVLLFLAKLVAPHAVCHDSAFIEVGCDNGPKFPIWTTGHFGDGWYCNSGGDAKDGKFMAASIESGCGSRYGNECATDACLEYDAARYLWTCKYPDDESSGLAVMEAAADCVDNAYIGHNCKPDTGYFPIWKDGYYGEGWYCNGTDNDLSELAAASIERDCGTNDGTDCETIACLHYDEHERLWSCKTSWAEDDASSSSSSSSRDFVIASE